MGRLLRANLLLCAVLGATALYAILRYNVFKGVAWTQLPLWVLNKSVAWSSVVMFLAAAWEAARSSTDPAAGRHIAHGSALAGLHLLLTLPLLSPANYPALFDDGGQFTMMAGLALLAGSLAAMAILSIRRSRTALLLLPAAVAIHTVVLGAKSWFAPAQWPGYMVPITFLSFLAAAATLGILCIRRA